MILKPQDVLILMKLVSPGPGPWTYSGLAGGLGLSASEVHAGIRRALAARLAVYKGGHVVPKKNNLMDFLTHGLRYVFVPERGGVRRGVPTAAAAPPLAAVLGPGPGLPPVWPDPHGEVRGEAFAPLYRSAPLAARNDPALYRLLALIDAVRGGRPAERSAAVELLAERLAP